MFRTQLRAILRASAFGNVRMMLPLITSVDELRHVRALVAQCREELAREGLPCGRDLPLGVMIETPAAVVMARLLVREADFFSIGTNDLTQYVMAADRKNTQVAEYYSHYDPAVVRSVEQIAQAAREGGIPVAVCGEAGADPLYLPLLLSFGVRELSVLPAALLPTRKAVSRWSLEEAHAVAARALELETENQVRAWLEENKRL